VRRYLQTLRAGVRLALFLPVRAEALHASAPLLAALFATDVLLHFLRDFAYAGADGTLNPYGLPGILFLVPVLLVAAMAAAWALRRGDATLLLATAFAALALPIGAIRLAAGGFGEEMLEPGAWARFSFGLLWSWGFTAWLALAAAVAACRLLRPTVPRGAAALALTALLIALPLHAVYPDDALWTPPAQEAAAAARELRTSPVSEEALYQQPRALARMLEGIAPGQPGRIDLYYLGFGGYASQDVFLREIRSVDKLMRDGFGTGKRSVSLLNNQKTLMDLPMASVTSLRMALSAIGERMNRDEDILFLYLTSHGSSDHRFSLDFWPVSFNELTPPVLKKALDDARIRWRVVVVSACYSGGFIAPLQDDHTIVISAAAADRKSFGCTNEAEWTYFGRAFFEDSLPGRPRLEEAFAHARGLIEQREKETKMSPHSNPQIAAGAAMVARWDAYLQQSAAFKTAGIRARR
jgi:hypothetical protein